MAKGFVRLVALQDQESGLWPDQHYSVLETTLTAMRLLHDYGLIGP